MWNCRKQQVVVTLLLRETELPRFCGSAVTLSLSPVRSVGFVFTFWDCRSLFKNWNLRIKKIVNFGQRRPGIMSEIKEQFKNNSNLYKVICVFPRFILLNKFLTLLWKVMSFLTKHVLWHVVAKVTNITTLTSSSLHIPNKHSFIQLL